MWFKRDLRVHDNPALAGAITSGNTRFIAIIEPELWDQPDMSDRHAKFYQESLADLQQQLHHAGQSLEMFKGNAIHCLTAIHQQTPISALWSNQETWNDWTYQRDIAVKAWCKANGVSWHEPVTNGSNTTHSNRNGWSKRWDAFMTSPQISPIFKPASTKIAIQNIPSIKSLSDPNLGHIQVGGRQQGRQQLHSFLTTRGIHCKQMSSPLTAFDACSQVSPHWPLERYRFVKCSRHFKKPVTSINNLKQNKSPSISDRYARLWNGCAGTAILCKNWKTSLQSNLKAFIPPPCQS